MYSWSRGTSHIMVWRPCTAWPQYGGDNFWLTIVRINRDVRVSLPLQIDNVFARNHVRIWITFVSGIRSGPTKMYTVDDRKFAGKHTKVTTAPRRREHFNYARRTVLTFESNRRQRLNSASQFSVARCLYFLRYCGRPKMCLLLSRLPSRARVSLSRPIRERSNDVSAKIFVNMSIVEDTNFLVKLPSVHVWNAVFFS